MEHNKLRLEQVQASLSKEFEIFRVIKQLNLRTIAYRCGISKNQGVDAFSILVSLIFLTFLGKSIHHFISYCRNGLFDLGSKDIFYRLSTRQRVNWRRFLSDISFKVINQFSTFKNWEQSVLIIDDTIISKKGKKIEGLSWVFDHVEGKSVKGFAAVVLGWSDRSSFIPIDFALQGSKNKVSKDLPSPEMDKRTLAWHRRQEASKDKITLTKEMLIRAKNRGVDAGAVLFDSWYCYPKFVSEIFNKIGYDVISMVKTTPNLSVLVNGKTISTRRLWEQLVPTLNTETKKMNKETITTSSIICKFGDVAVKLVFCQPTDKNGKLKKKVILLSTNTELSSSEIVDIYGQRWAIEVLFKDAKSKLFFGKYQSRTFEATICFLTLSLVRFVILGYMERMNGDFRHKGSLYEDMRYEIEELNILAFMDKFLNRLLSLVDGAKEIFTLFTDKLSSIQEMVRLSIENLLFQRCET